jgi:hypothetical protein
VVSLLEEFEDILTRLRLSKKADKPFVLEMPGDILQCPQVVTGLIGRRDQQEENIDRLAVQCREINASPG